MKNMKLKLITIGLLFGTSSQFTSTTELDQAIHAYLETNKEHLASLAKIETIRTEILYLLENATPEEQAAYKDVIEHFNKIDGSQIENAIIAFQKALMPFKKALAALKSVNAKAHKIIIDNLDPKVRFFVA